MDLGHLYKKITFDMSLKWERWWERKNGRGVKGGWEKVHGWDIISERPVSLESILNSTLFCLVNTTSVNLYSSFSSFTSLARNSHFAGAAFLSGWAMWKFISYLICWTYYRDLVYLNFHCDKYELSHMKIQGQV